MSKGMLGKLPLSQVGGPVQTLFEHLAGENGEAVLRELKKFNRRERCWVFDPRVHGFLGPYAIPVGTASVVDDLVQLGNCARGYHRYERERIFIDSVGEPYQGELLLYAPTASVYVGDVEGVFEDRGLKHATYIDLLAFVATQQLPATKGRIIALGSVEGDEITGPVSPQIKYDNRIRSGEKIRSVYVRSKRITGNAYILCRK